MKRYKIGALTVALGAALASFSAQSAILTICESGCDATGVSDPRNIGNFDDIFNNATSAADLIDPTIAFGSNTATFGGQLQGQTFTRVAMPGTPDPQIDFLTTAGGSVNSSFTFNGPTDPATNVTNTEVMFDTSRGQAALVGNGFATAGTPETTDDILRSSFGPISIVFADPVSAISGLIGSLDTVGAIRLEVFDINGDVLGTVDNTQAEPSLSISRFETIGIEESTGAEIIYGATFYMTAADAEGFGLHNLTVAGATSVPVPASLALLGLGLVGLRLRRKS